MATKSILTVTVLTIISCCILSSPVGAQRPDVPLTNSIRAITWSPDGEYIAFIRHNGIVGIVDPENPLSVIALPSTPTEAYDIEWNPAEDQIAAGIGETVYIWNTDTGEILERLDGHLSTISSVAWNADGSRLVTTDQFSYPNIFVWNTETSPAQFVFNIPTVIAYQADWNANQTEFAVGGEQYVDVFSSDGEFLNLIELEDAALTVKWHPTDNGLLAAGTANGTTYILSTQTWEILLTFKGHMDWVFAMDWHPDGDILASGGRDGVINFWTLDGEPIHSFDTANAVYALEWSPDGSLLAYGGADNNETLHFIPIAQILE